MKEEVIRELDKNEPVLNWIAQDIRAKGILTGSAMHAKTGGQRYD